MRTTPSPLKAENHGELEEPSALDYVHGVVRRGRHILAAMFLAAVLAAIISLILPPWYAATTSFLPAPEERASTSLTTLVRGWIQPGGGLPEVVQAGDLSVTLMRSRRICQAIVEEFDLIERYRARDIDEAISVLDGHTSFYVGQEGLVSVTVEDRDPQIAAAMANRYVELLDRFNARKRMTSGRNTREFIEGQLEENLEQLHAAEDSLEAYMAATKSVPLWGDMGEAAQAGAELLARKMALEIQLEVQREYLTEGSEVIRELETELEKINAQLEELPALNIDFARRLRELKVQETLHQFLRTQYEESRIREQEDTATLTIVDPADPPLLKSRPQRKAMVLAAAIVTGLLAVLVALVATYVELLPPSSRRRRVLEETGRELRALLRLRRQAPA